MTGENSNQFEYEVALSFAGEDRAVAETFANLLIAKKINVFYDEAEASKLWGKNLTDYLAEIYGKQARYCVMFISKFYPLKKWTNFERAQAQARALRDPNEYILPIRLDDTEVPGLAETISYIDLRQHSIESVVNLLEKKLVEVKGKDSSSLTIQSTITQPNSSPFGSIPMPTRKKTFSQLEKDRFAKEAFHYINQYFQHALRELQRFDLELRSQFDEVTNLKFSSKIYEQGKIKSQCNIWLGDDIISNTIYYNEGVHQQNDKAINDYLPVIDNGKELCLQIGNLSLGMVRAEESQATQQQAAEYLWKRFISPLQYQ